VLGNVQEARVPYSMGRFRATPFLGQAEVKLGFISTFSFQVFDSVDFVPIFEAFGPSTSPYGSQQGGICYTEMVGASSSAKVRLGIFWDTDVLRQLFSIA
jgi:hypothetical protein